MPEQKKAATVHPAVKAIGGAKAGLQSLRYCLILTAPAAASSKALNQHATN